MNQQHTIKLVTPVYYRLIALWVLNEAMLGGIIHGLKLPVSGLIVGSCAAICICLIAWYVPKKGAILKATLIVAIFKMMLSPQAPPPAYIAVFFQGMMGEFFFLNRKHFKLWCVLFAVLALLESGLQRILVLTIVYGNDLWKVINTFLNGLIKQRTGTNYSLLIGGGYVLLHVVTGLLVGWWAGIIPGRVKNWSDDRIRNQPIAIGEAATDIVMRPRKKKKIGLFIIWIILVLLYVQSYFRIGVPILPSHIALKIFLRSLIIILSWYFIISPLLCGLLHNWLQKKQTGSQWEVQQVLGLLPSTRQLVADAWRQSAGKKGWQRIKDCCKMVLANILTPVSPKRIILLTGPVQSGKTTALLNWSDNRKDIFGILTPIIDGKRVFMNAYTRQTFPMLASEGETETITVGRFVFSKSGFDKANAIISDAIDSHGWLIIDEIGPLELRGEGFSRILEEVLSRRTAPLILVIRDKEETVQKVCETFLVHDAEVIRDLSLLHELL